MLDREEPPAGEDGSVFPFVSNLVCKSAILEPKTCWSRSADRTLRNVRFVHAIRITDWIFTTACICRWYFLRVNIIFILACNFKTLRWACISLTSFRPQIPLQWACKRRLRCPKGWRPIVWRPRGSPWTVPWPRASCGLLIFTTTIMLINGDNVLPRVFLL